MKWFLAFLGSNVITFTYASIVLFLHFVHIRDSQSTAVSRTAQISFIQAWLVLLRSDVLVGSLFLFVCICDLLVFSFLCYHSYLVFSGVTTNETLKFEDVRVAIATGDLELYSHGKDRFCLDVAGKSGSIPWSQLENVYDEGWIKNFQKTIEGDKV